MDCPTTNLTELTWWITSSPSEQHITEVDIAPQRHPRHQQRHLSVSMLTRTSTFFVEASLANSKSHTVVGGAPECSLQEKQPLLRHPCRGSFVAQPSFASKKPVLEEHQRLRRDQPHCLLRRHSLQGQSRLLPVFSGLTLQASTWCRTAPDSSC